jgi:hypothetical protein
MAPRILRHAQPGLFCRVKGAEDRSRPTLGRQEWKKTGPKKISARRPMRNPKRYIVLVRSRWFHAMRELANFSSLEEARAFIRRHRIRARVMAYTYSASELAQPRRP